MVGRCFLNFRPFLSRWLFSATYSSPCWAALDIRDTSSPWSTTSCSERTNTSLSSSSRFSISLMTRWRSSTSRRRRRAASNSMLELGVTSLEEGAVAEVDGGSEPASRAPVTLRKSPMEMERLVAGDARARRAEADPEGGMANGGRGGEDDDDDDDGESGGSRSGSESGLLMASVMYSVVSSLWVSVFFCRLFIASFWLFLCCCCPFCHCWCFLPVFLCQLREQPSRECRGVLWCSLGTAPFINKRSEPGLCRLCVWVVVRHFIGCWTHEHVSWWLGSLPLYCWCWQAVSSSAWLFCFVVVIIIWSTALISSAHSSERCSSIRSLSFFLHSFTCFLFSQPLCCHPSYKLVSPFSFFSFLARMVTPSNTALT